MRDHPEGCPFAGCFEEAVHRRRYGSASELRQICATLIRSTLPCRCHKTLEMKYNTHWKFKKERKVAFGRFIIDPAHEKLPENSIKRQVADFRTAILNHLPKLETGHNDTCTIEISTLDVLSRDLNGKDLVEKAVHELLSHDSCQCQGADK